MHVASQPPAGHQRGTWRRPTARATPGVRARAGLTPGGRPVAAGSKGFGDPVTFDNAYYVSLLKKPWLDTKDPMSTHIGLPSDHVLPEDAECLPIIQQYAGDQDAFFNDFAAAYVKLCSTGAVWA
jgi:catalase (peroxidase I)